MLELMNIHVFEISKNTTEEDLENYFLNIKELLKSGKRVAFLVRKEALVSKNIFTRKTQEGFKREDAIKIIVGNIDKRNLIVSTTGKISRELYELTVNISTKPFLTVGSMGHASMIALGIAINEKNNKIYCLDGDGATLMHMGSLATIGEINPPNFYHILLNNSAHESVGNMPTTTSKAQFTKISEAVGYKRSFLVKNEIELIKAIKFTQNNSGPIYIEVKVSNTSRNDLLRPKETPEENKLEFMKFLRGGK